MHLILQVKPRQRGRRGRDRPWIGYSEIGEMIIKEREKKRQGEKKNRGGRYQP